MKRAWTVALSARVEKRWKKDPLPDGVMRKLVQLMREIEVLGPVRGNWASYSKLKSGEHHCHLGRKYVACWREHEGAIDIEVYYAGSRENAPY
jgi:hypothetical protein